MEAVSFKKLEAEAEAEAEALHAEAEAEAVRNSPLPHHWFVLGYQGWAVCSPRTVTGNEGGGCKPRTVSFFILILIFITVTLAISKASLNK